MPSRAGDFKSSQATARLGIATHAAPCLQPKLVAQLRSEAEQPSRVASLRSSAEEPQPIRQPAVSASPSFTRPATSRCLDPTTSLLGKHTCLAVRTRQVNLQHDVVMTRTVMAVRRCRDGECNDDLSVMLYDDAMCMYTAIRSSMDIDMTRVTRWGPRIPIVLGVPRGTEDQSYVPTGAHVARVRERARDWVEDEARARASWRATRSDRGES
ncbi:hypothetical protein E6C27_scaffold320G00070 [Cucumis melo var. makuwa]|uniref:Uncharacterized protein n=1 Tax=Cucumis melo var. makuwa TaxID=1194695 RepID=A0A5A7TJZ6_CUCMM|nr:hypothetical protein E6C27_scaffold320G00070 [Cucumis melo var. makuwa]